MLTARVQVHQHGSEINARQDSISIGGISAGGHISAVCQQQARDAGIPLKLGRSSSTGGGGEPQLGTRTRGFVR